MEDSFGSKKVIAMVDVFCERFVEDDIKKWVKAGGIPTRLRDSLRKSDLWPYIASPALGGLDVGLVDRAAIIERCMRNTGAMMPVVSDMISMALFSTFRPTSQGEIVEGLFDPSGVPCFSQAFTDGSADPLAPARPTTVTIEDNGVCLNGEKAFVSGGQFLPSMLVLANDPVFGATDGGKSLWLFPSNVPGVETYPIDSIGQEMMSPAFVVFDRVNLDPEWRIQTDGKLGAMLDRQYHLGRLFICAACLGLAEAAYDDALSYVSRHVVNGRVMGSLSQTQEKIVAMESRIRAMRWFVYDAASKSDPLSNPVEYSLMKCVVPKASVEVASTAMQLFGARGYSSQARIGRIWRDCRGCQLAQGTDELVTTLAARSILAEYNRN